MATDMTRLKEAGLPVTDLGPVVAGERHPLLFATVSGAHLYGFPSKDSDVDLRGSTSCPRPISSACASPRRPGRGCGTRTAWRWIWSPMTFGSSSG